MLVSAKTGEGLEGILERILKEVIKKTKRFNDPKNIILNINLCITYTDTYFSV